MRRKLLFSFTTQPPLPHNKQFHVFNGDSSCVWTAGHSKCCTDVKIPAHCRKTKPNSSVVQPVAKSLHQLNYSEFRLFHVFSICWLNDTQVKKTSSNLLWNTGVEPDVRAPSAVTTSKDKAPSRKAASRRSPQLVQSPKAEQCVLERH
jgi:hypothetical protein